MKVLDDVKAYAIKVDVYMYSEDTDTEHKKPMYVTIDTETNGKDNNSLNSITFKDNITKNLVVFNNISEANNCIDKLFKNNCSCENPRVVEISLRWKLAYDKRGGKLEMKIEDAIKELETYLNEGTNHTISFEAVRVILENLKREN